MSTEPEPGTQIRRINGAFEVRLGRFLSHDRATVWSMLTDAQHLPQWLAPGTIEPRPGGRVRIDFAESGATIDGTVRAIEPLARLEYNWGSGDEPERPLCWQLEAVGDATRLTLTLRLPAGDDVARACAGWDAHLEMLQAALEGVPIRFPVDRFRSVRRTCRDLPDQLPPDDT